MAAVKKKIRMNAYKTAGAIFCGKKKAYTDLGKHDPEKARATGSAFLAGAVVPLENMTRKKPGVSGQRSYQGLLFLWKT